MIIQGFFLLFAILLLLCSGPAEIAKTLLILMFLTTSLTGDFLIYHLKEYFFCLSKLSAVFVLIVFVFTYLVFLQAFFKHVGKKICNIFSLKCLTFYNLHCCDACTHQRSYVGKNSRHIFYCFCGCKESYQTGEDSTFHILQSNGFYWAGAVFVVFSLIQDLLKLNY